MKKFTLIQSMPIYLGIFLLFGCEDLDESPTPVLTRYDFPPEVLESIFTPDIPKEIRNVDNFLDKIKQHGMIIHEGNDPPEISNLEGNNRLGVKFNVASDCIYDSKFPSNADSIYGKYEETIQIFKDPLNQNSFMTDVSYSSVADASFPKYHNGLDKGSGRGYASGNGNNFTLFFRVENGSYDNIPYEAIWIISGTVPDSQNVRELSNVTKCLVMLEKGVDKDDKVANRGTIRIFKDDSPDWIQADVIISDFSPTEGHYSTLVTINGSGFSSDVEENAVRINNVNARVLASNHAQLLVEVPKGAGTGPVSVQVLNKSVTGNVFTYIPVYTVSTLAGIGKAGFSDGSGTTALFDNPYGIAVTSDGTTYVADMGNRMIRKITPAGEVNTLLKESDVPFGVAVFALDHIYVALGNIIRKYSPNNQNVIVEGIKGLKGIAVDSKENIFYSAESEKISIWKISLGKSPEPASKFQFNNPSGVAVDDLGNIYVAETGTNVIRKITPTDVVSTIGESAKFNNPIGVAVDASGNVYVADRANHQIRKITPAGVVSTLAGTGQGGYLDGIGSAALFNNPTGVAIDANGIIYVADSSNHRIRKMVLE